MYSIIIFRKLLIVYIFFQNYNYIIILHYFSNKFRKWCVNVSDRYQLADIILVPKDGGNVIRADLWAEAQKMVEAIQLIEVS
jgi:hypothetical protein